MDRRIFLAGAGALWLAGCAGPGPQARLAPGTTLYVVRHGEKDGDALTKAGVARAEALALALAEAPIDRIYSTSYARNRATAAPVAAVQDLEIETVPDSRIAARILPGNEGRALLWVGNKGNIAPLWEALSLTGPAPLNYGDLAVVRADASGVVTVEMRRFGK